MAEKEVNVKVRLRTDSAVNWLNVNPVLLKGEIGVVSASSHVDQVWLALSPFLIHELVDGVIQGLGLNQVVHDQEEGLAQLRWTTLGGWNALGLMASGLVSARIDTGERGNSAPAGKAHHIPNLSHMFWASSLQLLFPVCCNQHQE